MNKQKYEVVPEKIDEYLEDWIPSEVRRAFYTKSPECMDALHSGSKVKNKKLWWKRLMEHQRENRGIGFFNYINWEIETFIRKYPYFSPLFVEIK